MTHDPSKDRIELRVPQVDWMGQVIRWVLHKPAPKPKKVRITHCTFCGKETETSDLSDAPMIHCRCRVQEEAMEKVLKKKEQENREQVELIKTAILELKQEGKL